MNNESTNLETKFSGELIQLQLQKIFSDSFFVNSEILRRFLSFVVEQTLAGHANWLKEYTIGLKVLNKSSDFKPQDNGIVRIHAGRLRRALHHYYSNAGAFDPIQISIPKGGYVPVFSENGGKMKNNELSTGGKPLVNLASEMLAKPAAIAVMPFQHFNNNPVESSLVDGLGLQLCNALMQFDKYSVIAYSAMRDLCKKTNDISKIASFLDARYIIAGSLQTLDNQVRSHSEIIDSQTGRQLWSCMYEGEFISENIFKLQDEIVQFIIAELARSLKNIDDRSKRAALAAVA